MEAQRNKKAGGAMRALTGTRQKTWHKSRRPPLFRDCRVPDTIRILQLSMSPVFYNGFR
jgi:hypothetical protein